MFGWLKRRFGTNPTAVDVFAPIIDGKPRRYDPLVVWRSIEKQGGVHWVDLVQPLFVRVTANMPDAALENIHKARQHSIETLAEWVRKAFGLKPFAEGGPTETRCVDLLAELMWYVNTMADAYRPFSISKKREPPSASTPPEPRPDGFWQCGATENDREGRSNGGDSRRSGQGARGLDESDGRLAQVAAARAFADDVPAADERAATDRADPASARERAARAGSRAAAATDSDCSFPSFPTRTDRAVPRSLAFGRPDPIERNADCAVPASITFVRSDPAASSAYGDAAE